MILNYDYRILEELFNIFYHLYMNLPTGGKVGALLVSRWSGKGRRDDVLRFGGGGAETSGLTGAY